MTGSSQPLSAQGVRRPAAVDPPPFRAPRGTELVRLRLSDRPGSLAAVTAHLAACGVDVLRLEVVDRGSGTAVDDLLLSGPAIDSALATLGSTAMLLGRRPGADLRDPGLAMASACEAISAARTEGDAHRRLVAAALGLVVAEAGLLAVSREGGVYSIAAATEPDLPAAVERSSAPLVASALASGECLTADGRIPWAPASFRDRLPAGSVAIVPGGSPPELALALVRADHAPFVSAELDRLSALMRVAVATLGLHGPGSRVRLLREAPA